ncbi:WAT1-related protein At5g07050-like [Silene latifolia]|uniref:WAT1-related protein At5g07050-like n=1 Tax=Silene latifolia TaxID=37657 RepID=UPI003D786B3D
MQIFGLGLLGPVIDQNFYYMGLKYTSPTFSCAMSNMLPAMTFVMALICRMEKVDMKKLRCIAKVVGTLITVGGAMLMTLYKGHVINMVWSSHVRPAAHVSSAALAAADKDWAKGSILLILATLAWAAFFILQAITMRRYSAHLSLTALVCFMGTLCWNFESLSTQKILKLWPIYFSLMESKDGLKLPYFVSPLLQPTTHSPYILTDL